jgi:CBS-domain-containing membrane protein
MRPTAALPTFGIESQTSIAQVGPWAAPPVTLASPAVEVMTDLTRVKAATTRPDATLPHAEQTMIHQGVRMLFVVSELPDFLGLVTTTDLYGDRAVQLVHDLRQRRDELTVADVMTPLASLDAVDYEALRGATVSHLVGTLQRLRRNHLLVVQSASAEGPRRVRGVVSRTQIERQLGQPIAFDEAASTFAELERALA